MIYLLLTVICSTLIAAIFKTISAKNISSNDYAIISFNYLTAFIFSTVMVVRDGNIKNILNINFSSLGVELINLFSNGSGTLSPKSNAAYALICGTLTGTLYFLSFILYQKSIAKNGIGVSGTFSRLGILVPVFLSIVLWADIPNMFQFIGILLAVFAIVVMNYSRTHKSSFNKMLIFLLLTGGFGDFFNKLFQKYSSVSFRNLFLFFVFLAAFILSFYFTIKSKYKLNKKDLILGIILGIPNLFSTYFFILALSKIQGSIAFPLNSSLTILAINFVGVLVFKEKLSQNQVIATIVTTIGVILMNL